METLKDFDIMFAGLKQGVHSYNFEMDNTFFGHFGTVDFLSSNIKVELEFIKQSTLMIMNFDIKGEIVTPCDRCLDDVNTGVEGEEKLIVKFGNEFYEETDEILIIPENENQLNVAKHIYEFIKINVPQKKVHQENLCNPDVIEKLEKVKRSNKVNNSSRWTELNNLNIS